MFEIDSARVRKMLLVRKLTITEFARRADVTTVTARKFFHTDARATAPTVAKIADALEVEPQFILKGCALP